MPILFVLCLHKLIIYRKLQVKLRNISYVLKHNKVLCSNQILNCKASFPLSDHSQYFFFDFVFSIICTTFFGAIFALNQMN